MKKNRIAIIIMLTAMIIAVFSITASASTGAQIGAKINEIKGNYIGKSYGTDGCHKFVNAFSQALFGVAAPQTDGATRLKTNANWYFVASGSNNSSVLSAMKSAQPGDVFRYKSWYKNKNGERKENAMHTAMVTAVSDYGISVIQHTNAGRVHEYTVAWSQLFSSTALGSFDGNSAYGLGLYRCTQNLVGQTPAPTPHTTHVKGTYKFAEAAHPHYKYWECSVCRQLFTDGSTEKSSSCSSCYPAPSVTATVTTTSVDSISQTAATVRGQATASGGKITEVGMYFGTSANNLTKLGSDSGNWNSMTFYYNTTKFGRTLSPGTTYYYQAYAIAGGKTFWGGVKSFTTTAPTPDTTKTGWVTGTNGQALAINDKAAASPTYSNQIGRIPEGASCTVYTNKTSGNWYWVSYGGVSGYAYSKYISFTGPKPVPTYAPTISVNGQNVTVSWNNVQNETSYDVYLVQAPWAWADIKYSKSVAADTTSCTFSGVKPGGYAAFVISRPNADNVQSKWTDFGVQEPPNPTQPYTDKTEYSSGSNVTVKWNSVSNATSYWINVYKDGKNNHLLCKNIGNVTSYTLSSLDAGTYLVYIEASNNGGTSKAVSCEFSVIAQHAHRMKSITAVQESCSNAGNKEYWQCSDCGKYYADSAGKNEVTRDSMTIPALGHNYTNGSCTRCGANDPNYQGQDDPAPVGPIDEWPGVHFPKNNVYFQDQFVDVPANQWFTFNVAEAFEFSLMKGVSATKFNPYGDVTIAEAITMASRIHSIYTTGSENFVQESGSKWYQVYLDYALRNGIINQAYYNCDVNHRATRAQYAEIFANAMPGDGLHQINNIGDGKVPDVPMNKPYASKVYKLYRAGILTGGDAMGTFSPDTYITRAESAAIVSRMAESDNRRVFVLN